MSSLTIPNAVANGLSADGNDLDANFDAILAWANAHVLELGGGTLTGALLLAADPTVLLGAATKQYCDNLIPKGTIWEYSGATLPAGTWAWADGSEVLRVGTYADLFAAIGTTHGAGNGTTTFNLPNKKGKVGVGKDATQTEFDTLGETGGAKTHALTSGETGAHTHDMGHGHTASSGGESVDHSHAAGSLSMNSMAHAHTAFSGNFVVSGSTFSLDIFDGGTSFGVDVVSVTSTEGHVHTMAGSTGGVSAGHTHAITVNSFAGSTGSAGSGTAHNNLQPYVVMNYIVRY